MQTEIWRNWTEYWAEELLPGSLVLVGGDPGIGKSTLAFAGVQTVYRIRDEEVLYISGEESSKADQTASESDGDIQ